MLKADLHIHTKEDPKDGKFIQYTARQIIDHAARYGFDVLAVTNHEAVYFDRLLESYAKRRGILLIPGAEAMVEGKEVLTYGITHDELEKIKIFDDLTNVPFKIAPHPFYPAAKCLKQDLVDNLHHFDAIEFCHFYTKFINHNVAAINLAKQTGMPMVGTSDSHRLFQFNRTYTYIDADAKREDVFEAIRKKKVKVHSSALSTKDFLKITNQLLYGIITKRIIKRILPF